MWVIREGGGEKNSQVLTRYKDALESNTLLQILIGWSSLGRLQLTETSSLATPRIVQSSK